MADLDYVANFYQRELGLTPAQARGAARWMSNVESGLRPDAFNPAGGGQGALGIAQWRGPRQRVLLSQYGPSPTLDQQLQFSKSELLGPENAALRALRGTQTENQAFQTWGSAYERPGPIGQRGPTSVFDPESGRDVPRIEVTPLDRQQPFPVAALDALLGGQPLPTDEGGAYSTDPLALLSTLLGDQGSAGTPGAPAGGTQTVESGMQPWQPSEGPLDVLSTAPPLDIQPLKTSVVPTQLPSQVADASGVPDTPPHEQGASLLDRLLGAVNPIGTAHAAEVAGPRDFVEPPAQGQTPTLGGQQPAVRPESLLDSLLRYGETSLHAAAPAMEQIPQAARDVGQMLAGGVERIGHGEMSAAGITPPPATIPVQPGLSALGGLTDFLTGGYTGPHGIPAGAGTAARTVARSTVEQLPELAADTAGSVPRPPPGRVPVPRPPAAGRVSAAAKAAKEWLDGVVRDVQIKAVPMAAGTDAGRAIAKDYANLERLARMRRSNWDRELRKIPVPDQVAMWEAMDNASVAAQAHGYDAGKRFIDALPKEQRDLVMAMERHGVELWEEARDAGLVHESADRLPFYVPRSILEVTDEGASRIVGKTPVGAGAMEPLDQFGVNMLARGPRSRAYSTAAETEAAAQSRFGANAQIVRNIRSLPLAYERFERAIAGRRMINDLKEIGLVTGKPAVVEGGVQPPGFFTIPGHPMFQTARPRMTEVDGKVVPARDQNGKIMFDRQPLYVSRDFEGPLRAVARHETGGLYHAAMMLKAANMAAIMNSPAIHNLVEWGRAMGAMPGKVVTFKIYSLGAKALANRPLMEQAVRDGLVPIGDRGYLQDIEGIATGADLQPGRGLLAKGAGALTDIVSPKAGEAVRRGIDKAGDFWHQKLLWDQVAKLQAGLYSEFAQHLAKKGIEPSVASKMAAHFANRYAGALPAEAMSEGARKFLNVALFSRSFTMGNLGVIKDMLNGLPRDVRAQIGRDLTALEKKSAGSLARRKAIATVMVDIAIGTVTTSMLQSTLSMLRKDASLDDEAKGYADRLAGLMDKAQDNPLSVLNPLSDLEALSATAENEPDRENRALLGHADDGTAVYLRSPVGKIGEEFSGWFTKPLTMLRNKEGTIVRPLLNLLSNDDGLHRKILIERPQGMRDYLDNARRAAWELVRSQIPEYQAQAAWKLLRGKGDWVDTAQAVAPFLGGTISRGAPGGEAVGELYAGRGSHTQRLHDTLPQVKDLVKDGKIGEAEKLLDSIGVPPRLRNYYVKVYRDPSVRMSPRALKDFERYATPEQRQRLERAMQRREMHRQPASP